MLPNKPIPPLFAQPIARLIANLGGGMLSTLADKHHHIPFAINKLTHNPETYAKIMESF